MRNTAIDTNVSVPAIDNSINGKLPLPSKYNYALPKDIAQICSSLYGWRTYDNSFHKGLDFKYSTSDTKVYAIADGVVSYSSTGSGYGNVIVIKHENLNRSTLYAHLADRKVAEGDTVRAGDVIATIGNTSADSKGGVAYVSNMGKHIHFEVSKGLNDYSSHLSNRIDPLTVWRYKSEDYYGQGNSNFKK